MPRAVVRAKKPKKKAEVDEPKKTIEIWEPKEDSEFSNTATVTDQKENPKYAGTWMEGPLQFDEFDMGISDEKAALNRLMALKDPEGAPGAVIETLHTHTFENHKHWKFLVGYRKVQYRTLVSRRVPVEEEEEEDSDESETSEDKTPPTPAS